MEWLKTYKEGYYQSNVKCPKCKKHNVESTTDWANSSNTVWFQCCFCDYEWESDRYFSGHVIWDYVGEAKTIQDEIETLQQQIKDNQTKIKALQQKLITLGS